MQEKITKQNHIPVLADEVLDLLEPKPGDHYLDLTAGYGGHARMIADRIGDQGSLTLVDRDEQAIKSLKQTFSGKSNMEIIHQDFLSASQDLVSRGKKFNVILADLGVSSPHLNNASRGFAFSKDGPLDMRMDQRQEETAADLINSASLEKLAEILRKYGEVKNPFRLAKALIANRPYATTQQLADKLVELSPPRWKKRTHPATEVFQSLRIAVNNELEQIEKSLPLWIELLSDKGRIGIISFHSLEDRLVKQAFADYGGNRYDARLHIVTKRPIMGSDQEIVFNPRARSAKLRVAQRK